MVLLSYAVVLVAGVLLADLLQASVQAAMLLAVGAVALSVLLATLCRAVTPGPLMLALAAGVLRVALAAPDTVSDLPEYHGLSDVILQGVVVSNPEAAGSPARFRLRADTIATGAGQVEVSEDVLVTMMPAVDLVLLIRPVRRQAATVGVYPVAAGSLAGRHRVGHRQCGSRPLACVRRRKLPSRRRHLCGGRGRAGGECAPRQRCPQGTAPWQS